MTKYFITMLSIISALFARGNLLTNGDFEQELDVGWQQFSTTGSAIIDRATNYDPDPDYEALIYDGSESGYSTLYQIIEILSEDLASTDFSCNAKFNAYINTPGDWVGAAIILSYMNGASQVLGETRICQFTTYSPWINSSTLHLMQVNDENVSIYSLTTTPNPCIEATYFNFELPKNTVYQIDVFDILGRSVQKLNGVSSGYRESVKWNCKDNNSRAVDAGVYFYRFNSNTLSAAGKIVVR